MQQDRVDINEVWGSKPSLSALPNIIGLVDSSHPTEPARTSTSDYEDGDHWGHDSRENSRWGSVAKATTVTANAAVT
jgi:hypothetical protein